MNTKNESYKSSRASNCVARTASPFVCSESHSSQHGVGGFRRRVQDLILAAVVISLIGSSVVWAQTAQYTQRAGNNRQGLYDSETFLTPQNVTPNLFGHLFSFSVDGTIAGQPLYVPNVSIGVGTYNVIYVATQNDSVYAFNADTLGSGEPLWQVSLLNSGNGTTETPEPISATGCTYVGFTEIGIMGTPVIDPTTNTIYLVAKTMDVTNGVTSYLFRLHALDITTGQEKFGGPVVINASVGSTTLASYAQYQFQRPALLEVNGTIYVSFGSDGCDKQAHGWLLAYNASTLQQQGVFNASPSVAWGASLWMSAVGPAADADNNVYVITANGTFNIPLGGSDWGDTMLKLTLGDSGLAIASSFTPFNQSTMAGEDLDLGSGAPVLLPTQTTGPANLLVSAGKTGTIYLVNCDAMGGYTAGGPDDVVQELPGAIQGLWSAPTYWNNAIYFAAHGDRIKAFPFVNGIITTPPVETRYGFTLNGVPVISANGNSNGILWLVHDISSTNNNTVLSAFNASTLQTNLAQVYDTQMNSARDALSMTPHFVEPLVTNGRVYVGTDTQLMVYGLFPELNPSAGNLQSGRVDTPISLTAQAVNPYTGAGLAGVPVAFSDGGRGGVFNPATENTDSNGNAATSYTMPKTSGTVTITATSSGYSTATFTEKAVAAPPATVATVSGFGQSGTVGTTLPAPLVAKVEDKYGNLVVNAQVTFADSGLNGTFQPNPATTGTNGDATATFALPTVAKAAFAVTASSGSATPAVFHETSLAGTPASVATHGGNKQVGTHGKQLPIALQVLVQDQYGNGVPNVAVNFSDNGAGGSFSSSSPVTNNEGGASTLYTLPTVPGTWTITASVGGLETTFTEVGN